MYAILILDSRVTRAFYWPEALFSEKINGTQFPVSFVVPFLLRQLQHVIFFCVPAESFFFLTGLTRNEKGHTTSCSSQRC